MKFKSVYVSGLLAVWPVMQGMAQSELIKFGDLIHGLSATSRRAALSVEIPNSCTKSVRMRSGTRTRLTRTRGGFAVGLHRM
mgnify:CR=1 FL=1